MKKISDKITDAEKKQWDEAYAPLVKWEVEQDKKRVASILIVKNNVSDDLYNDILEYIGECDYTTNFEITSVTPDKENKQEGEGDFIKEIWVDQYCNGGYGGDDFAGWIHIKINKTEYLKFHYSM